MASTQADGISIEYDEAGAGDPPLLLLTGWCSSRGRYDRFLPLASRNRRAVRFDWRGHGGSGDAGGDFGVEEMTRDALAVVEAAGLDVFVPVSASHSGWVAIELRRRLGDRVPKLVHLDWLMVPPSEPYMDVIRLLQSEERWPEARDTLFRIWRGGLDEPFLEPIFTAMNEHGAEMWMRSGHRIEESFADAGSPFDALAAFDDPPEVLHVYGQPRDPEYLARQERFAAEHPWFRVQQVDAQSHFAMAEAPEQVAEAVESFLR